MTGTNVGLSGRSRAGAGGRELGRRFTDSAGSRRQEQARGENAILRSERGAAKGGQHRQAAGAGGREQQAGRESRTAGRHGRRAGQTRTAAGAAGGTTSLFPLHKYICREQATELMAINKTSDNGPL